MRTRERALLGVADLRGVADGGLVGAAEPAALGQRAVEDALQPRRGVGDDLLGVGEALGVPERLDGRVDLRSGVAGLHRPQRTRYSLREVSTALVVRPARTARSVTR